MNVATVGYERTKIPIMLGHLLSHGVTCIVDVRENPWSNRPDCRRHALQASAISRGLRYVHAKYAGNPKSIRTESSDPSDVLVSYERYLDVQTQIATMLYFAAELEEERGGMVALLCYENHFTECHRGVLTSALVRLDPRVNVLHIDGITGELQVKTALISNRPLPVTSNDKRSRVAF